MPTGERKEEHVIEQLVREGIADVDEVKRWIDNDVEAGDEAIRVHADALERVGAKFEEAAQEAARLHELTGPDYHIVDHNEGEWALRHPLACHADGLLYCAVHRAFMRLATPEIAPGRWRVELGDDGELAYFALETG